MRGYAFAVRIGLLCYAHVNTKSRHRRSSTPPVMHGRTSGGTRGQCLWSRASCTQVVQATSATVSVWMTNSMVLLAIAVEAEVAATALAEAAVVFIQVRIQRPSLGRPRDGICASEAPEVVPPILDELDEGD